MEQPRMGDAGMDDAAVETDQSDEVDCPRECDHFAPASSDDDAIDVRLLPPGWEL